MRAVDRQPPTKEALRKAYTEFAAAIKANPRASWAHSHAAFVSTELNDLKEAKILILRAIELDPAEPTHQFRYAYTMYRMGERVKAKEMMTNLLEAKPNWLTTRGPQGAQRIAKTVLGEQ